VKSKIILLAIIVISTIIFTRTINDFPLRNWDEAWYAEIIKNMASGNYSFLMPFWNGRYYFDHAPLYFWLSSGVVIIFGLGEWQVRFTSALSATIASLLVFLIGKKLFNVTSALIAFLVFLTLGQVVMRFSHGNLDALLIMLYLLSFYTYLKAEKNKRYSVLCGIFLGLGILVKSWGIGLFPLFLIFTYSFIKNRSFPKNLHIILIFAFLSFIWWYIWGFITFDKVFTSWYILNPSEGRLDEPFKNFSFHYFKALIRDVGYWLLVPALSLLLKAKSFRLDRTTLAFLTVSIVYVSSLNFLSDKSDWYNLPIYPLIALTVGHLSSTLIKFNKPLIISSIALLTILGIYNVIRIENIYPDRSTVGAELGKIANKTIPKNSEVILDDPDFTAFLYYSNQNAIYTLEDNKRSDFAEWWKISHTNLENFIKTHPNTWIITRNPQNLAIKNYQIQQRYNNYYFLRI